MDFDLSPPTAPSTPPVKPVRKPVFPILLAVVFIAVLAGGGAYTFATFQQKQETDDLQAQVSVLTSDLAAAKRVSTTVSTSTAATATPTPAATAAAVTPTPTPAASQITYTSGDEFRFSVTLPPKWRVVESTSCEGLCGVSLSFAYEATNGGKLIHLPVNLSAIDRTDSPETLDELLASSYRDRSYNVSDSTFAGAAAKKFDDGGGMFGYTYTYIAVRNNVSYTFEYATSGAFDQSVITSSQIQAGVDAVLAGITLR